MKSILLVLAFVASCFALSKITIPYQPTQGSVASSSGYRQNNDTLKNAYNRAVDTMEISFVRFTDVKDSIFQKIKCDSIRSNPDVDSIQGNPFIDTITTRHVVADSLIGPVRGNISGGKASLDSLQFGIGDWLKDNYDTTFACSLYDGATFRVSGTAYAYKMGHIISINFPQLYGTCSGSDVYVKGIPAYLRASNVGTVNSVVRNNGAFTSGNVWFNGNGLSLTKADGNYLDAGNGGINNIWVIWGK